jgi:uncharacterized protein
MKKLFATTALALSLLGVGAAHATDGPSFNCRYAKTPDEVLICQNAKLSKLDRRLAEIYSPQRNATFISEEDGCMDRSDFKKWKRWLKTTQTSWLRQRHACRYDAGCIEELYSKRIAELEECQC